MLLRRTRQRTSTPIFHRRLPLERSEDRCLLAVADALPEAVRNQAGEQMDRGGTLNNLGLVAYQRDKSDKAATFFRQAIECQTRALDITPNDPMARRFMLNHHFNLARALFRQRKHREASAVADQIAGMFANDQRACLFAWEIHNKCGKLKTGQGVPAPPSEQERVRYHQRAVELLAQAAKARQRTPDTADRVARLLLEKSDSSQRDTLQALATAETLTKRYPQRANFWRTLGVARYRGDDLNGALAALEKSQKLAEEPDAVTWFFLSMVHANLGQMDEARRWFNKGAKETAKLNPAKSKTIDDREQAHSLLEELIELREEAEAVLKKTWGRFPNLPEGDETRSRLKPADGEFEIAADPPTKAGG